MTRRLITALLPLALCLLFSSDAFAQFREHAELNVFGAGSVYSRNRFLTGAPQSAVPVPGDIKIDPNARFGARFGVYTRGHWGEEFFYSFEPNTVTLSQVVASSPRTVDLRVRMHNYGVNALYYLVETESHALQPFLSAGLGGVAYQIRQESLVIARDPARGLPDINNSNELAFNFGLGFKARSSGWFGIRLDARDFISRSPSFGLVRQSNNPSATVMPATGVTHNAELSVGLTFYFSRR
jgi:hypothetical protein